MKHICKNITAIYPERKKSRLLLKTILIICFTGVIYHAEAIVKVACVGNSVTYGATLQNPAEESYPARLQQMLGDQFVVKNFGKSGSTLLNRGHRPYRQQKEFQDALNFSPDIVVIHLGLNDTDPRNWPNYKDDFIGDYLQLIKDFQSQNPKVKIFPCRMTPIFDWHKRFQSGTYTWYHQIQQAIEKVASLSELPLIDLNEDLAIRPDLFPDAIHPDKYGAEIIAKRVYASLTGDFGGLKLAEVFSDGMVLQREQDILISGTSNAKKTVIVEFAGTKHKTVADFQGKWKVILPSMPANKKGRKLTITSDGQKICIQDVVVGDVWLCSGQSNMAFPFNASIEFESKRQTINKNIRLFRMTPVAETNNKQWDNEIKYNVNSLSYFKTDGWAKVTDTLALHSFSAVAISFGNILADSLDIPIALIQNAVGGSPQEAWISRSFIEKDPALVDILSDFYNNDRIQEWCRTRAKTNTGQNSGLQQRHPYQPAYLYESGIKPLNKFDIKGVIWYQGESNAHNVELYELLFKSFVECWRYEWNSNLPIIFAQLSSIDRPSWPYFRNSQRILSREIPDIYMAVTSDLGDSLDVHPRRKYSVGERMAACALSGVYKQNVPFSGPLYNSYSIDGKEIIISFEHANGLQASDGNSIRGFEICGEDGLYYPATAIVSDNKIHLHSDAVKKPRSARYAWQSFTRANLVNTAGLPASTFETKKSYEK